MSFAMLLVLPMFFLIARMFAKKVYLADGLTVEEYKVRKETVNLFLAKILIIGVSLIGLYLAMIIINVAIFLAPYILGFFMVLLLLSMISGIGDELLLGAMLRSPMLALILL